GTLIKWGGGRSPLHEALAAARCQLCSFFTRKSPAAGQALWRSGEQSASLPFEVCLDPRKTRVNSGREYGARRRDDLGRVLNPALLELLVLGLQRLDHGSSC